MPAQPFGIEHITYIVVSTILGSLLVVLAKKYAKNEKTINIILKVVALLLFIAILYNFLLFTSNNIFSVLTLNENVFFFICFSF